MKFIASVLAIYVVTTLLLLHFIFPAGLVMLSLAVLVGGTFAARFAG